jgi:outer membrane protein
MRKLTLSLLLILAASPLLAENRSVDASIYVTWVDLSGDSSFLEQGNLSSGLDFSGDQGYGATVNLFVARRLSLEFGLSQVSPEARIQYGSGTAVGTVDMLPITGVLQYHFNPEGKLDPYAGVGVAYIQFSNFNSRELGSIGLEQIDFRDDYGMVYNAGISFEVMGGIAIVGDAKYVPLSNTVTTRIGETTVDTNPLILSVGVGLHF